MTGRFLGVAIFFQFFSALAMLSVPYLTHRDLLFGVPVPHGFRSTEAGRKALRAYRMWIAIPAVAGLLGVVLLPDPWIFVVAVLAPAVIGIVAFVTQNQKLKPFAIQPPMVRQVELGPAEPLPGLIWLGILPLLFIAGVAAYLHSHWDQIPLRFPVHFNISGIPDRWTDRSERGVYGLLVFGGELSALMFGMALAGWYGSRRSDSMRKPMVLVMLAAEAVLALTTGSAQLQTAGGFHIPVLAMVFGPLAILIPALVYAYRENIKPRDPVDPTPNECWKGGMIYYNPDDAALFVQRRDSMGFTINLGNRWSWMIYGSLIFALASGAFLMKALN